MEDQTGTGTLDDWDLIRSREEQIALDEYIVAVGFFVQSVLETRVFNENTSLSLLDFLTTRNVKVIDVIREYLAGTNALDNNSRLTQSFVNELRTLADSALALESSAHYLTNEQLPNATVLIPDYTSESLFPEGEPLILSGDNAGFLGSSYLGAGATVVNTIDISWQLENGVLQLQNQLELPFPMLTTADQLVPDFGFDPSVPTELTTAPDQTVELLTTDRNYRIEAFDQTDNFWKVKVSIQRQSSLVPGINNIAIIPEKLRAVTSLITEYRLLKKTPSQEPLLSMTNLSDKEWVLPRKKQSASGSGNSFEITIIELQANGIGFDSVDGVTDYAWELNNNNLTLYDGDDELTLTPVIAGSRSILANGSLSTNGELVSIELVNIMARQSQLAQFSQDLTSLQPDSDTVPFWRLSTSESSSALDINGTPRAEGLMGFIFDNSDNAEYIIVDDSECLNTDQPCFLSNQEIYNYSFSDSVLTFTDNRLPGVEVQINEHIVAYDSLSRRATIVAWVNITNGDSPSIAIGGGIRTLEFSDLANWPSELANSGPFFISIEPAAR